jgi:hypothetical protein
MLLVTIELTNPCMAINVLNCIDRVKMLTALIELRFTLLIKDTPAAVRF